MIKEVYVCDECGEMIKKGIIFSGEIKGLDSDIISSKMLGKADKEENHYCSYCFAKGCNLGLNLTR